MLQPDAQRLAHILDYCVVTEAKRKTQDRTHGPGGAGMRAVLRLVDSLLTNRHRRRRKWRG